jgi:hypothetical protein
LANVAQPGSEWATVSMMSEERALHEGSDADGEPPLARCWELVAALRRELLDQWETNHSEHCGSWDTPHERCYWLPPTIIRDASLTEIRQLRGWPYPVPNLDTTSPAGV